ncbi:MAG TPA: tRNA preQ1(34) S-adenosylmethionine ribosyltransferase-isomerase QueA [Rhizomicrobium sp.]|nr:tRNA preQ1(34) S-adenosylmethionine ribosyltransferase-isomerase QueA [Rhizomicrobium sp.]
MSDPEFCPEVPIFTMQTKAFDFDLPPELIALRPAEPREAARLLIVHQSGQCEHCHFRDLPRLLRKGDMLSFNDSRVIPARLTGLRPPRAVGGPEVEIEITLHTRLGPQRYLAFAQPARRLRARDRLHFGNILTGQVLHREGGEVELAFDQEGEALDHAIARAGVMPLPPYIAKQRPPDERDRHDYQTVYAAQDGSIAAPTAGLHFSHDLLRQIDRAGIGRAMLTLHVGAGTFLPVAAEDTAEHVMHAEHAELSAPTAARINAARALGGRIGAVGTTALRTLESAANEDGLIHAYSGDTRLFITPGYRFKAVDFLITNFHLPRSTLFMLVSAFMGLEVMRAAYAQAIREAYRFYSYGDACLLLRKP